MITRYLATALLIGACLGAAQAQSAKVFLNNKPFAGRTSGSPSDVMIEADTAFQMLGLNITIAPASPSVQLEEDKIDLTWTGDVPMLRAKDLAQHFGGKYDYSASLGAVDIYAYDPVASARKALVSVLKLAKVNNESDFGVLTTLTRQILVRDLGLKIETPAEVLFSTPAEIAKAGGGEAGTYVTYTREHSGNGTAKYKFMVRQGMRPVLTIDGLAWSWGITWANLQGDARDRVVNHAFAYWTAYKAVQSLAGSSYRASDYRQRIKEPAELSAFDNFVDTDRLGGPEAVLKSFQEKNH